jgi:hypothetical protein
LKAGQRLAFLFQIDIDAAFKASRSLARAAPFLVAFASSTLRVGVDLRLNLLELQGEDKDRWSIEE